VLLPTTSPVPPATKAKLQELETALSAKDAQLAELSQQAALHAAGYAAGQAAMDAELQQLRAEIAEARKRNEAAPDTHDYNEKETRVAFIDLMLAEADWELKQPQDREYEVSGMPSESGVGYVDYVLWGKDGKPLGLVETKLRQEPAHRPATGQALASNRPSSMPTACTQSSASARSSSTPTATSIGCGTTWNIHRARSAASTRTTSWSC
jgi:hypothetical protein